jgi:hypothetical protein
MSRRHKDMRGTRLSHSFYADFDPEMGKRMKAAYPVEGYYTYLLHQDLDHVVRYDLGRSDASGVRVVGPDAESARGLIADALSDRSYPSLSDGVRDLVNRTSQQLVFTGSCTYEMDFLSPQEAKDGETPTAFDLHSIAAGTLDTLEGCPIQYVLDSMSSLRNPNGDAYVVLDESRLARFFLPTELVAPVRALMNFLLAANGEQGREFALQEQSMQRATPYDFSAHLREKEKLFAEVTQPIGWTVRGLFTDSQLEPYRVWREIRFQEFKVTLRECILTRLNEVLRVIGGVMGFSASIEVFGLPTADDVRHAKDDFRAGSRGLGDLATWAI